MNWSICSAGEICEQTNKKIDIITSTYLQLINPVPSWTFRETNSGGGDIFRTRPHRPTQPPIQWARSLSRGLKRPGHVVDHPSPSSTEIKETVGLYPYSPSGPSWPVLGRTSRLPLPLPLYTPFNETIKENEI